MLVHGGEQQRWSPPRQDRQPLMGSDTNLLPSPKRRRTAKPLVNDYEYTNKLDGDEDEDPDHVPKRRCMNACYAWWIMSVICRFSRGVDRSQISDCVGSLGAA